METWFDSSCDNNYTFVCYDGKTFHLNSKTCFDQPLKASACFLWMWERQILNNVRHNQQISVRKNVRGTVISRVTSLKFLRLFAKFDFLHLTVKTTIHIVSRRTSCMFSEDACRNLMLNWIWYLSHKVQTHFQFDVIISALKTNSEMLNGFQNSNFQFE